MPWDLEFWRGQTRSGRLSAPAAIPEGTTEIHVVDACVDNAYCSWVGTTSFVRFVEQFHLLFLAQLDGACTHRCSS